MRALKTIRLRVRSLLRGSRVEQELDEELRDHLEREIARHLARGLSPADARAAALREFGNVALVQEQVRDMRRVGWIEDLARDVAYAFRSMRRAPGYSAIAALSLAAAIGANTTTFSIVNALMLRDLPVDDPHELVQIGRDTPTALGNFSYPLYERVRDQNTSLSDVIAVSSLSVTTAGGDVEQPSIGRYVTGNFFEALGVGAALGRAIDRDDDRQDAAGSVVVITHAFWLRQFGGRADVIGETLPVRGAPPRSADIPFTIVGVLPPSFRGLTYGRSDDFYLPLAVEPRISRRSFLPQPGAGWLKVIGRLKPGASRDVVQADVDVIYARFVRDAAPTASEAETRQRLAQGMVVESASAGLSEPRREFARPVRLLMGAVALVLLVACANVVNLLLARGLARRGEVGVRLALGASRSRIARQLLAESLLIGLCGGSLGLAIAVWGTPGIARMMANEDPAVMYDVAPDATVLLFTVIVSFGAALAAALMPALRISRASVTSLREDAGTRTVNHAGTAWSRALVAFQVALSLLLLAGTGLLVTTLRNLTTLDAGFDRDVILMGLSPERAGYEGERRLVFYREVLTRARHMSGVRAAGLMHITPISGGGMDQTFGVEGEPPNPDAIVYMNIVSDGYFAAMGTHLLQGRDFSPQDGPTSPPVAVVNESLARRYFNSESVVGRRIRLGSQSREIVGVVADAKYMSLREANQPTAYLNAFQVSEPLPLTLSVKSAGDPESVAPAVERELRAHTGAVPIASATLLSRQIARSIIRERLVARILGAFAALSLLLAAAGLYGVLAYTVAQRTNEIGVRMALGATRGDVLWPVLADSTKLVALGVAIGIPAALALTRLLSNLLYGVTPTDPGVLGGVVLSLFLVALAAGAVPAWRAARVDPLVALRHE